MGGVSIGQNTIIGAGSVVTKNISDNVIAAGVPCKVIREITDADKTGFEIYPVDKASESSYFNALPSEKAFPTFSPTFR